MSQQEFEPREQRPNEEIHQPHYPYSWSTQEEGMPRDEPPGSYSSQSGEQYNASGASQVPWWARPQPQQGGPQTFATIIGLAIFLTILIGGLGIAGVVLGALAKLLAVILGAIIALVIFVMLLAFVILSSVSRAIGRAIGPRWVYDRRTWRYQRRMARRAARRSWRGW